MHILWVYFCTNWKNHIALLECSVPLHGSLFLNGLLGLESRYKTRSKSMDEWVLRIINNVLHCLRKATTFFSGKAELISSDGSGAAASTDKQASSEFRGSVSPALPGSSHISPLRFSGYDSYQINALPLIADRLRGWEFNLFCNSGTCRRRFQVWFAAN